MHRLFTAVMAALWALCLFVSMPAAAQDTTPPVISSVVASPAMVSPGDAVHVQVTVSDDTGVTGVTAGLYPLENTSAQVWEGDIPADAVYAVHNISVVAVDAAGNSDSDGTAYYRTVPVVGIRCDVALDAVVLPVTSDYLFMMWGKATYRDENTFTITDGGGLSTWVTSPNHGVCNNDFLVVKGILDAVAPPAKLAANYYRILNSAPRTEMNIGNVTVGKDLQISQNGSLPTMVPYGTNLQVTITSSDASKVLLSKYATAAGSPSIMLTVPGGSSNIPTFYIHGLADSGSVDVMATAPGCLGKTFKVTLAPSGFIISYPSSITTTSFSPNTGVNVKPARLNPSTLAYSTYQNLRGGISVSVNINCTNPEAGVLTESTLTFNGGEGTKATYFDPRGAGTSIISVVTPEGFSIPSNYQQITAVVGAPDIMTSDALVGLDLQTNNTVYLQTSPPEPVDMVVTVANESIATITTDPAVEGTKSITFEDVDNASSKTFYVQGRALGTTTITTQAVGYNTVTKDITVNPSGFVISTPGSISTTSFSTNTSVQVRPARLRSDNLGYSAYQSLRGGLADITVSLTSSEPGVGIITPDSLIFTANSSSMSTSFDPISGGTTTISVTPPQGFSTPSSSQSITATVTAPSIIASNVNVGKDLQASSTAYLQSSPPSPVNMIVSVDDPTIATLSTSATVDGTDSVTFANVSNTSSKTFYVQGRTRGTTTLTVEAVGYTTVTKTITVDPSGFVISSPGSITTTSFSTNSEIQVKSSRLNPTTLAHSTYQNLRPGIGNVEVAVVSSNTSVGTTTTSPLIFTGNTGTLSTYFDPAGAGTATISVSTPSGFDTPSNNQEITATVTEPGIYAYNETVGRDLQKSSTVSLEVAPPTPVTITVTVGDPAKATITTNATAEGSGTVTFASVSNTSSRTFYVQGRSIGTTTLTVSAPGYTTVEKTITIDPSGFVINSPSAIVTKVTSSNSTVQIAAARLNPSDYRHSVNQSLRGGLTVSVPVMTSDPDIGTITISPVVFNSNITTVNTQFDPIAVGATVISVGTPTGFTTPTTMRQINATVNP